MPNLEDNANLSLPGPVPGLKPLFLIKDKSNKKEKTHSFSYLEGPVWKISCSETSLVAAGVQFHAMSCRGYNFMQFSTRPPCIYKQK